MTSDQDGTGQVGVTPTTTATSIEPRGANAATPANITTTVGVTAGGEATVTAKTSASVVCAITVSGAGRVPGLDAKQTDTSGNVTWTWTMAAGTTTSSWAARVDCSNSESIEVAPTRTDRVDQTERTIQRDVRGQGEVHEKDLERRTGPRQ